MFCMTKDVVAALQTFLKNFSEEGLSKAVGENVSDISAQVKTLSESLTEVNQLQIESPSYILQGLTKGSIAEFTRPFKLLLNQEQVNQMSTLMMLGNTTTATMKQIKQILVLAKNSYHSLNTSNSWNFPTGYYAAREFKILPRALIVENLILFLIARSLVTRGKSPATEKRIWKREKEREEIKEAAIDARNGLRLEVEVVVTKIMIIQIMVKAAFRLCGTS